MKQELGFGVDGRRAAQTVEEARTRRRKGRGGERSTASWPGSRTCRTRERRDHLVNLSGRGAAPTQGRADCGSQQLWGHSKGRVKRAEQFGRRRRLHAAEATQACSLDRSECCRAHRMRGEPAHFFPSRSAAAKISPTSECTSSVTKSGEPTKNPLSNRTYYDVCSCCFPQTWL